MPKLPPRKGIAPEKKSYLGFRDKIGQTFRSGPEVFVLSSHAQWGTAIPPGGIPTRLYRFFAWPGDKLGAYRLDSQYAWCLNHAMVMALGSYVFEKIPADILEAMRLDPYKVVETAWAVTDEFETVVEDVEMRGYFSLPPSHGAYQHMGTLDLAVLPSGKLKKHGGVNYARGFRRWTQNDTLSTMVPSAAHAKTVPAGPLQPCSADYSIAEGLATRIAPGGGPDLEDGEQIEIGADELIIHGVEYSVDEMGGTAFAYITGNPFDDPLTGTEMLTHEMLRAIATDPTTINLLNIKQTNQRQYLCGAKELLPGWRDVSFARSAIRRTIVSVNPTLVEGVALLRGGNDTFSFECAVLPHGALRPLRRCSDSTARRLLPRLLSPSVRALRQTAQVWLQDVLRSRTTAAARNLDPLEFKVPCPFAFIVAMPCFGAMKRSPEKKHVLTHIFTSNAEVDAIVGILGWHAPMGKETNGFFLVVVPQLPEDIASGTTSSCTLDPRRVTGLKKHEYNFISFDTETQELTVRLSVARFNASVRVRGASVGPPPADPPPAGGTWKYSLLLREWVPNSVRAPTPRVLKERYPACAQWMHW